MAGLTVAIACAKSGREVLVFEKNSYPKHKVCGEYLSNEIIPYLDSLGISLPTKVVIDQLQLSNLHGEELQVRLPLGGVGISRYAMDYHLYKEAKERGVQFIFSRILKVTYDKDLFHLEDDDRKKYTAEVVVGAYGKRSGLDKALKRKFIFKQAPWLGVKAHYEYEEFPDNFVGLHAFKGGYAGLSKTETGQVNFCYLASYASFKPYGQLTSFTEKVVGENPFLRKFLSESKMVFDKPISISQISFSKKKSVENHVLMCGDAAGLIHPLCGNGMAMAIHAAKLATAVVLKFLEDKSYPRQQMENDYEQSWSRMFSKRLAVGRQLQRMLLNPTTSGVLMKSIVKSPFLVRTIIKQTHGKPVMA